MPFDFETLLIIAFLVGPIVLFVISLKRGNRQKLIIESAILLILGLFALYYGYRQLIEEKKTQSMVKDTFKKTTGIHRDPYALSEPDSTIRQAISLLHNSKFNAAKTLIKEVKNKKPNVQEYLYSKAIKWRELEVAEFAKDYLTLYISLVDNNAKAYYELGNLTKVETDDKNNYLAIDWYTKAINTNQNFIPAYLALGEIYEDRNEISKAEEYYRNAVKIDPEIKEAREKLANLYFYRKEYDKAIDQFEKLVKNSPDNPDLYSTLASCYYEKKLIREAMDNIEKALQHNRYNINFLKFKVNLLEKYPDFFIGYESKEEKEETDPEDSLEKPSIANNKLAEETPSPRTDYTDLRITIFNASDVRNAANHLGFFLRRELGIRYSRRTHHQKMYQTIIYYGNSAVKPLAMQIANRMPGKQRVGRTVNRVAVQLNSVGIQDYKDIVIYLGNDCANVGSWAYQ